MPRPAATATGLAADTAPPVPRPAPGASAGATAPPAPPVGGPVPPVAGDSMPPPVSVPAPVVPGVVHQAPALRLAPQDRAAGIATALRQAVLTVDQEAMYRQSLWGQRAAAELARQSQQVSDDNDSAFAALVADEDALTAARPTLSPDEFRRRAAAFDERVTAVRRERDAAREALQAGADRERALFFQNAAPVMGGVMAARGALVVLDQRTVLISDQSIDATAAVIAALDAELGDGSGIVAAADAAEEGEASGGATADAAQAAPEASAAAPSSDSSAMPPSGALPSPTSGAPDAAGDISTAPAAETAADSALAPIAETAADTPPVTPVASDTAASATPTSPTPTNPVAPAPAGTTP